MSTKLFARQPGPMLPIMLRGREQEQDMDADANVDVQEG